MTKRGRRGKKKPSTVLKPEINIVDEGESSFDVSEVTRQKKAAAAAAKAVSLPSVEVGVEAVEENVTKSVTVTEANNFTIKEVTAMRKFDSLSVIGKQESINSNFSFFSDNNLTEREDLEDIDQYHHHFVQKDTNFHSYVSEETTFNSSVNQADIVLKDVSLEEQDLQIEELEDEDLSAEKTKGAVAFSKDTKEENVKVLEIETSSSESSESASEVSIKELEENEKIDWSSSEIERFTDQTGEADAFLQELHEEINKTEKEVTIKEKKTSKLGWDNLIFKKEIKLEFKASPTPEGLSDQSASWRSKFENILKVERELNEETLSFHFPDAATRSFDSEQDAGLVSSIEGETCKCIFVEDNEANIKEVSYSIELLLHVFLMNF